ncbi:MAG: pentapeptide repeat-containing protein [Rhizomicrobium sp.]
MFRLAANALTFAFLYALLSNAHAASAFLAADAQAVASIKAGHHDCAHCNLAGADLTNQCVKGGDLEDADFTHARLVLMCMSYADFTGASFRDADLAGANLAHARLDDADLTGADLTIASVKGTDLSRAKGLTQKQLDQACGDAETRAPPGLTVKPCS